MSTGKYKIGIKQVEDGRWMGWIAEDAEGMVYLPHVGETIYANSEKEALRETAKLLLNPKYSAQKEN